MDNDEKKRKFVHNLNNYVSSSGKRQQEIAYAIGVNPKTFNGWCRGVVLPSVPKLDKIAEYFGIDRNDLLGDSSLTLTDTEKDLIRAYRDAPESRREAVRALLNFTDEKEDNHLFKPF